MDENEIVKTIEQMGPFTIKVVEGRFYWNRYFTSILSKPIFHIKFSLLNFLYQVYSTKFLFTKIDLY
jgi:hypothetical protein